MKRYNTPVYAWLLFFIFILVGCKGNINQNEKIPERMNGMYTYEIIHAENNTFGYDIFNGEKPFIHQPNIPGVPGVLGFISKEEAEKTARLVIQKLEKNIMPPTITRNELDSLHITY